MRAYGKGRCDSGCCPGHDRFPRQTYRNRRSKAAQTRDTKIMHRMERRRSRMTLRCETLSGEHGPDGVADEIHQPVAESPDSGIAEMADEILPEEFARVFG